MFFAISSFNVNHLSRLVFPAAIAFNMFSTTLFLIVLSLMGQFELAADVGIIQGAILAVFMAFSANARNLILAEKADSLLKQLLKFRVLLLLPLSLVAYFLSISIIETTTFLTFSLILRRCTEWLAELNISEREKSNDIKYAYYFVLGQLLSFFVLIIAIGLENNNIYTCAMLLWAILPLCQAFPFIIRASHLEADHKITDFILFLPHIGSSWIIAISTYVFRIIIILLVGKSAGGMLFSAYAIGGMLNSVYTYALGPSIAMRLGEHNKKAEIQFIYLCFILLVISGLFIVFLSMYNIIGHEDDGLFIYAIGYSLIGGGIMILAQRQRIHILQVRKENVFVPDLLSNILVVATVPFAFYIFGREILTTLFLWSACLSCTFYYIASHTFNTVGNSNHVAVPNARILIQAIIIFFIFLPVFFQLSGGIFDEKDIIFDSQGNIKLLPLPLGIIACFLGVCILTRYRETQLSATVIFSMFMAMIFSTIIVSSSYATTELGKFIFIMQFILPAFGLILGQSYVSPNKVRYSLEAVCIYVIVLIVPLQLYATYRDGIGLLASYLYFFSIYQHLQYVPVVIVGLFIISICSLYKYKHWKYITILLLPFVILHTFLSYSWSANALLIIGITAFILMIKKQREVNIQINIMLLLMMMVISFIVLSLGQNDYLLHRLRIIDLSGSLNNIVKRLDYWHIYLSGITSDIKTFLFGNFERLDRVTFPSAHNYYIDLVYNFGIVSILPILYLIMKTIKLIYQYIKNNNKYDLDLIVLIGLVLFSIFIDNSLKVSFRQPYPGIIMFFLWGVLISRLSSVNAGKITTQRT